VFGGWPLAALIAVASAIGCWELFRIARATGAMPLDNVGIAAAGITPLVVHSAFLGIYKPDRLGPASIGALVLLLLLGVAIWARGVSGKPLASVAITAFGIAYTGGMLSFGYALRYHPYGFAPATLSIGAKSLEIPSGGLLLLLPVFATWASDIGAYAVGRAIGRNKLIPSVSPGKTIEGAVGGLLGSMIVAWAYTRFLMQPAAHLGFKYPPFGALAFGALISVAAQIGDLVESLLKREAGVKDSSQLLPGHGGILDRFDSLLFVLPVSYVVLTAMLTYAP
jgi:phosphatidate cytidylyltransferase